MPKHIHLGYHDRIEQWPPIPGAPRVEMLLGGGSEGKKSQQPESNNSSCPMKECLKCKRHGLFFKRRYSPWESVVGPTEAPIWIIGLNPKGDKGHNDKSDIIQSREYFQSKNVHRYFSNFKKVSSSLYKYLGHPNGVAHTDLVKCYANNFPRSGKKEIIANCSGYLKQQIETHKPKIIICNGADVSRKLLELYPPETTRQKHTSYIAQNGNYDFAVVLSGFIGRIDDYAKRRLGQEIEGYCKLYGINLSSG